MFLAAADGGAAREEAYRRYVATTAAYLGGVLAAEASAKFETPVTLTFERLRRADVQGLARAVKALVEGGMSLEAALIQVGLV